MLSYYIFAQLHSGRLVLSLGSTSLLLWDEFASGYENANQAFLAHAIQFVCLISGPLAAAVFWYKGRPDTENTATVPNPLRHPIFTVAAVAFGLWIGYRAVYQSQHKLQPRVPLATQSLAFDSSKTPDLIAWADRYSASHAAHLSYYFMPVSIGEDQLGGQSPELKSLLVMATLDFPEGTEILLTNNGRAVLRAMVYSPSNRFDENSKRIWTNFQPVFRQAVAQANKLSPSILPRVAPAGEGGILESHWWDWRFHRK